MCSKRSVMEGFTVVLFLLLCLCGCALSALDCPPTLISPLEESDKSQGRFVEPLLDVVRTCYIRSENTTHGDLCVSLPEIRECFSREETRWNQTHEQAFKVFEALLEEAVASIDRLCANNAEKMNALLQEIAAAQGNSEFGTALFNVITQCGALSYISLTTVDRSQADLPSKVWYLYYQTRSFKECLSRILSKYEHLVELAVEQFDALLESEKCLDPTNEDIVLCTTIDPRQFDRALRCPILNIVPALPPAKYLMLTAVQCMFSGPQIPTLLTGAFFEDYLELFKNYCKRAEIFKNCQNEIGMAADICLNECEYKHFNLVLSNFNIMFDVGCYEEGRRLATIFYSLRKIERITRNVLAKVRRCVNYATDLEDLSIDSYHNYQQIPAVKQCFIAAGPTDIEFQDEVNEVFSEVSDNMQCLDSRADEVVLCKSILEN